MSHFFRRQKSAPDWSRALTASSVAGKQYKRTPTVQGEIGRVLALDDSEWMAAVKEVRCETLVYLIRHLVRSEDQLRGSLLQELSRHTVRQGRRWAGGLNAVTAEEIILQVDMEILELVLTETPSRQSDFLEIAFAQAVVRRTLNRVRNRKWAGNRSGERT